MITETSLWLLWLIVGLSVGCAVVLVIIIIVVVAVACRRRRSKDGEQRDENENDNDGAESIELNEDSGNYCTIPAAEAENNANEYCSTGPIEPDDNKEYSALGPPPTENAPYYLSLQND